MDSKQNGDDSSKIEMLDFAEKEKDHTQKGKDKRANKVWKSLKEKGKGSIDKFKQLSVERQAYIFVGGIMIFSLMIGIFGSLIIILLAAGILFVGISGKPFFTDFLKNRSWNKKEETKAKKMEDKKESSLAEEGEK